MKKSLNLKKYILLTCLTFILAFTVGCGDNSDDVSDNASGDVTNDASDNVSDATSGDVAGDVSYEELTDVSKISDNKYTCTYENVKHDFIVFLPDNTDGAPFILMLHGYGDSAEGFCGSIHFEEEACEKGYGVIYVEGAPDPNDPTSSRCWNSGIGSGGNNDVGFLCSLAKYLEKEYSFSEDRAYAAGFSNGAFMMHRLAMEASDVFSGVVSVAGKMPESVWDSKNENNNISFFQISGEKDEIVPKNADGSAKFVNDPAIEDVMDYWVSSNGLKLTDSGEIGNGSVLSKYSNDGSDIKVWNLDVKNCHHSWPEESLYGFDTNSVILDFLESI